MDLMKIGQDVTTELKANMVVTPQNYSLTNALKSAYLMLEETVDRNKKPALEVCSPASIHRALLNMAVQGLNPAKNQCYFVVYGTQLQCIRSYMGAMMTAKLVNTKITDFRAQVIYQEDDIEIEITNGKDIIKKHARKFQDISKAEIIGAYAIAVGENDNPVYCEVMTIEDIKQSWKQSKVTAVTESGQINQQSMHGKFTGEMAKRTVINRLCKIIINTSNDEALLSSDKATDEAVPVDERIQIEVKENANKIPIDIDPPKKEKTATKDQAKKINELSGKLNQKEKMIKNISGFIGREIKGLLELTFNEAEEYIQMLENELKSVDQEPDWA